MSAPPGDKSGAAPKHRPTTNYEATDPAKDPKLNPSLRPGTDLSDAINADVDCVEDLDTARYLIQHGVPVFFARPAIADGEWDPTGGHQGTGYWFPPGWEHTKPDPAVIDRWRPGDALCALMGHTVDGLDIDPRNGGDATKAGLLQAEMWPRSYGTAATPSGGAHELVAPLGVHSKDDTADGLDVKAGVNGDGHGFLFIAPTRKKSKTTGEIGQYRWVIRPDLDGLAEADDSGQAIADIVRAKRNGHKKNGDKDTEEPRDWLVADRIPAGKRRSSLLSYAGWLRDKNVRHSEAVPMMRKRWETCDQPPSDPMPWVDAENLLDDIYRRYEPSPEPTVLDDEQGGGSGQQTRKTTLTDRAYSRDQLRNLPAPEELITNTIDRRTVAALAGPRGSLKSFILLSWLCSVATGQPWLGRPVKNGRALLVAAEGAIGMDPRISAWETKNGPVPDTQFTVIRGPVNLLDRPQVDELAAMSTGYTAVGLDTLARCIVGGDENSAKDMGIAIDAMYRIQDATGDGSVLFAHHVPKNGGTLRGSSALEGNIDTIYMTDGTVKNVTLERTKRKDGPEEDTLSLYLELVGMSGLVADMARTLTNAADVLLSVYMSAFEMTGCSKAELRNAAEKMAPATFHRSLNSLLKLGILRNVGTETRPFYRRANSEET